MERGGGIDEEEIEEGRTKGRTLGQKNHEEPLGGGGGHALVGGVQILARV